MLNFLSEFWALLNAYKLRAYDYDGVERFAIPLSWLFVVFLLCLFSA
jgi:hypothetical protein